MISTKRFLQLLGVSALAVGQIVVGDGGWVSSLLDKHLAETLWTLLAIVLLAIASRHELAGAFGINTKAGLRKRVFRWLMAEGMAVRRVEPPKGHPLQWMFDCEESRDSAIGRLSWKFQVAYHGRTKTVSVHWSWVHTPENDETTPKPTPIQVRRFERDLAAAVMASGNLALTMDDLEDYSKGRITVRVDMPASLIDETLFWNAVNDARNAFGLVGTFMEDFLATLREQVTRISVPLKQIDKPEDGTRSVLVQKPGTSEPLFQGDAFLHFHCGACAKPLIAGLHDWAVVDVVIGCTCGAFNEAPWTTAPGGL